MNGHPPFSGARLQLILSSFETTTVRMITRYALPSLMVLACSVASAQLTILTQFNPSNTGGTCGIAYNAPDGEIMVIGCSASVIDRYAEDGTFISSADVVGEGANDVDIDMSPSDLVMNGTFVAQGQLLLVNGETGVAEIYAIDEVTNQVIDTLVPAFGNSHVVGGSYHPQRGTFFLVQDNVPGGFVENRVAEIDATTGDTIQTFSVQPYFDVNYGDLDISPVSGNLFIVSSSDNGIAEFTPDGVFITEHALPAGVSDLSGIALDNDLQGAWVCNTSGVVFKLGNFPVSVPGTHAAALASVQPNPASEAVTVVLAHNLTGGLTLTMLDALGRSVHHIASLTTAQVEGRLILEVNDLAPGAYTIVLAGPGLREEHRLMIQR